MTIAIGSDHAGFVLKTSIKKHLLENGYEVTDFGTFSEERTDYPIYGKKVAEAVRDGKADFGVVCCGSAEGISIVCNKVEGVRCGIGYNDKVAALLRQHNDANVIAFAGSFMSEEDVARRVDIFLSSKFEGGRHADRVAMINAMEK